MSNMVLLSASKSDNKFRFPQRCIVFYVILFFVVRLWKKGLRFCSFVCFLVLGKFVMTTCKFVRSTVNVKKNLTFRFPEVWRISWQKSLTPTMWCFEFQNHMNRIMKKINFHNNYIYAKIVFCTKMCTNFNLGKMWVHGHG